jgi:Glycosyl transferase family 2
MICPFALVTAARNEEQYLPLAIEAVLRQSVQPLVWIIVDDGSTDGTADIIRRAALEHPFIHSLSTSSVGPRSFGSKDRAINVAYEAVRGIPFDFVAIQDADIAPAGADVYECLLNAFACNSKVGVAGGYIHERHGKDWKSRSSNSPDSVAGGLQIFRRTCYEQIGGYTPLHNGGEDWLAQLDARMAGWEVLVLKNQAILHYRTTSSAGGNLVGLFRLGLMDASFGSHPIFEILKCARRMKAQPVLLGGVLRFAGYLWSKVTLRPLAIPAEKAAYLRAQQSSKLRGWWRGLFSDESLGGLW